MTRFWQLSVLLFTLCCGAAEGTAALAVLGGPVPQPNCTASSDCSGGQVCHAELRVCSAAEGHERQVALKVEPLPEAALVPSHQLVVKIDPASPVVDVTLPDQVRVTGRVRVEDNALESSVEVSLVVVAIDEVIPGEVRSSFISTSNAFELYLQRGAAYELQISAPGPDGGRPTHVETVRYEADTDVTFWLKSVSDLPTLEGRVVAPAPDTGLFTERVVGARVSAYEQTTLARCTTGVTGEKGNYTIRCPEEGNYVVTVEAGSGGAPIPRFDARLLWGSAWVDALPASKGLNPVPDVHLPVALNDQPVSLQVRGGDGTPINGATVRLTATLEDDERWRNASFSLNATTDRTGIASLRAIGRSYALSVIPPSDVAWARFSEDAWDVTLRESRAIELPARPRVTGTVQSAAGERLPRVRVALRAEAADGPSEFVAVTDELGEYSLSVDPGVYHVVAEPPVDSGHPSSATPHVEVLADRVHEATLPAPLIMEGSVFAADGAPVAGALVEALEEGPAPAAEYWRIARTRTDDTGRYFLVLPLEAGE